MLHAAFGILVFVCAALLLCGAVVANYVAEWSKFVFFNCLAFAVRSAWPRERR